MKRIIAIVLSVVLAFGALSLVGCSKKGSDETTTAAPKEGYRDITVTNGDISATVNLPELGGIEESDNGEGDKSVSIYTAADEYVYASIELILTTTDKESKDKTIAGERESITYETEKLEIGGCEACMYDYSEEDSRQAEFFIYAPTSDGFAEFDIYVGDSLMNLTDEQWQQIIDAVKNGTVLNA